MMPKLFVLMYIKQTYLLSSRAAVLKGPHTNSISLTWELLRMCVSVLNPSPMESENLFP